jgi:hypothetical protein
LVISKKVGNFIHSINKTDTVTDFPIRIPPNCITAVLSYAPFILITADVLRSFFGCIITYK